MNADLWNELEVLKKKENSFLTAPSSKNRLKETISEKVPPGLSATLEKAFTKAFGLMFVKGTSVIEKTFDKESTSLEHMANDFVVDHAGGRKSLRRMDKGATKNNLLNHAATTATGFGLGLLGMGLPDIPLVVSTLLKGIYEIALGYGFPYDTEKERIYILRLISTALSEGSKREFCNRLLEGEENNSSSLEKEIAEASKTLSDALLVEKFIQGIPIIGVVGGYVNHAVYAKTSSLAGIKYKKRYLLYKIKEASHEEKN